MTVDYFSLEWIATFLFSVIRIATPLIYVALCSAVSQQAGLTNMASEAMMLSSSLAGVIFSATTQNLFIGILGGVACSVLVALFICFATFVMKVDLYLMSIAMNWALLGGTIYVMWLTTGVKSNTAAGFASLSMPDIHIPILSSIPFIGDILSGHNGFTYLAILMTFLVWFLLFRTKIGLRMRAVGQNPAAAESVGINPRKIYTLAFVIAAGIVSLGGMFLSMGYQGFFINNITAGRGFIGLSASTIANSNPIFAALVSLVLGLAEAITNNARVYITDSQFIAAMPSALTVILIIVLSYVRLRSQKKRELNNRKLLLKLQEEEAAAAEANA